MSTRAKTIRAYENRDEAEVVAVWFRSGCAVYAFLPEWHTLTIERAGEIFREVIRPHCAIWVGVADERVLAFLAMRGSYIDRMYVDPTEWRKGWGTRLVNFAKLYRQRDWNLARISRSTPRVRWG